MKITGLIPALMILSPMTTSAVSPASPAKKSMQSSVQLHKTKKSINPIFNEKFQVLGVGLSKGQKLEKHQTPTPAFLFVQSGVALYTMGDKKIELQAGDYLTIPAQEMHEVEALQDSRLLLAK